MDRIDRDLSVPDDAQSDTPKRGSSRDSLFLIAPIRFEGDDTPTDVRIRNLSAGGLMAEIGRVVPIGTPVIVGLRGIGVVEGKIAWCAEGRVGVALDEEIDPKLARKPVGGGESTPIYAKSMVFRSRRS
ncbi:MAG: PilZ domain-containing protein [Methylobacterium mesophilicum]|nr:PilZ domain-containing protein [Methylobacterium mesophilicum]